MALISNPMGELTGPLNRVESSLQKLCSDLGALEVLPSVDTGVSATNDRLARVEEELRLTREANEHAAASLEAIRGELSEVVRLLAAGLVAGAVAGAEERVATAPSVTLRGRD